MRVLNNALYSFYTGILYTHELPFVCNDINHGSIKVILTHSFPLKHYAHAFGLNSCHGVIVISKQRNTHHGHTVIHGLIDAVQAPVAQEGPCACLSCGWTRDTMWEKKKLQLYWKMCSLQTNTINPWTFTIFSALYSSFNCGILSGTIVTTGLLDGWMDPLYHGNNMVLYKLIFPMKNTITKSRFYIFRRKCKWSLSWWHNLGCSGWLLAHKDLNLWHSVSFILTLSNWFSHFIICQSDCLEK